MRILYFTKAYTVHDARFLARLAKTEHDIRLLLLDDRGPGSHGIPLPAEVRRERWNPSPVGGASGEDCLRLLPEFEKVLEAVKPDLVHAGPVQSCAFVAAVSGFHPLMSMSWGFDILLDADTNDFLRWKTRYTLKRSDRLLCDCDAVRLKAGRDFAYPEDRVVQIPWGTDLSLFKPLQGHSTLREELGWTDAVVVISVRSWERLYGIEVLLEAFAKAYSMDSRLRLIMAGSGSLDALVKRFIADQGLHDVVCLPGNVPAGSLPGYFDAADIYLSCSRVDGTSVSLLEAMASGLPAVVSAIDGNREWVTHGENGWLAPVGDPEAFAALLVEAAGLSSEDRVGMGRLSRRLAEERANWEENFERLLKAYDELKNDRPQ